MTAASRITEIGLHLVELTYGPHIAPYEWSGGTDRHFYAILADIASEHHCGWGEGGCLASDPLVRTPTLLETWLDSAAACLLDRPIADYRHLGALLTSAPLPTHPQAQSEARDVRPWQHAGAAAQVWTPVATAMELALWDLFARDVQVPFGTLCGPGRRSVIEVSPAIGAFSPERAAAVADDLAHAGFRTMKIKGGFGLRHDAEILSQIRAAIGTDIDLRLDPNGAYDVGEARQLASMVERFALQYLEEPCPYDDLAAASALRRSTSIPIALDEAVLGPRAVIGIHAAAAADVLLLELHQLGGIERFLATVAAADACGLPLNMHAGYSTGIRTAEVLHLVTALPAFRYAPDTVYHDLRDDVLVAPLHAEAGAIRMPTGAGLGVEVDRERLAARATTSFRRVAEG